VAATEPFPMPMCRRQGRDWQVQLGVRTAAVNDG